MLFQFKTDNYNMLLSELQGPDLQVNIILSNRKYMFLADLIYQHHSNWIMYPIILLVFTSKNVLKLTAIVPQHSIAVSKTN